MAIFGGEKKCKDKDLKNCSNAAVVNPQTV